MSSDIGDAVGRFAWSAWGEIGVLSTERREFNLAIDVEALIHITRTIARYDARLSSHATGWQSTFPEFISKARLKRLTEEPKPADVGSGRSRTMSGQPEAALVAASAVQLRVRSALGVSARAEIVRQLLLDTPGTRRSSSNLAQLCGYTNRNTEKAMVSLERSGWIARIEGGASLQWSLVDHVALASLFAPLPPSNASFLALILIIDQLLVLDDYASSPVSVRSAAARGALANARPTADWGSIRLPVCPPDQDAWDSVRDWFADLPATAL